MSDLKAIEEKAFRAAKEASDIETLSKALEAGRIARELLSKEREHAWVRVAERLAAVVAPSTAVFAVVLSLLTLGFQIYQFHKSSQEQVDAAENSAWRDAVRNISLRDDSLALSSTIQMESFFSSPRYSRSSRSIASVLMPCVATGTGFDEIAGEMAKSSNVDSQWDLIVIAQGIVDEDWLLYQRSKAGMKGVGFADFLQNPTTAIADGQTFRAPGYAPDKKPMSLSGAGGSNECENEDWSNPLKRALVAAYNEDTISKKLAALWREHKEAAPGPAKLDISGIVLENVDLSDTDFSNSPSMIRTTISYSDLRAANMRNNKLDHAVITHLKGFAESKWDGSNWWDADILDCDLAQYLAVEYRAPKEHSQAGSMLMHKACSQKK